MIFKTALVILCGFVSIAAAADPVKVQAKLGGKTIQVEVADSITARTQGLMNRNKMGKDEGMLFVFDYEQSLTFWMKNTLLPLSIGFFDNSMKLVDIQEMKTEPVTVQDLPRYPSRKPARFALEMNKGWFAKNKIPLNSKLTFISKDLPPSLRGK